MRNRWLYPDNWDQLAWECKERAGWCCEHCGLAHGVQVIDVETGVVSTIILTAAHLDHDPWNPCARLAALCRSCHAKYDWSWRERQRWLELEQLRHRLWVEQYVYGESRQRGGDGYGELASEGF